MQETRNRGGEIVALIGGGCLLLYILIKAFSDYIGVDAKAGGGLLFSAALCLGLIALGVWGELADGWFGIRAMLPVALATLWGGLWPSMTYWGAIPLYLPGMPIDLIEVRWWANAYSHWGGMALIFFGGYALVYRWWMHR